jgi:hypothetical protein
MESFQWEGILSLTLSWLLMVRFPQNKFKNYPEHFNNTTTEFLHGNK